MKIFVFQFCLKISTTDSDPKPSGRRGRRLFLVVVLVLILTKCFPKLQRSFKNSGKKCHSLALNISYCSTFDFPTPRKDKCIVVLDIFFSSNHNIHKSLCDLCFLGTKPFNQEILVKSTD